MDDAVISSKGATRADVKSTTNGPFDVGLKRLVDAVYSSFACYHLTRSLPGIQSYDGAEAMVLFGKPSDSEKKQTIGLRLFFEADRVVKIIVAQRLVPALRASVSNCSFRRPHFVRHTETSIHDRPVMI